MKKRINLKRHKKTFKKKKKLITSVRHHLESIQNQLPKHTLPIVKLKLQLRNLRNLEKRNKRNKRNKRKKDF